MKEILTELDKLGNHFGQDQLQLALEFRLAGLDMVVYEDLIEWVRQDRSNQIRHPDTYAGWIIQFYDHETGVKLEKLGYVTEFSSSLYLLTEKARKLVPETF